jgi:hypothetical protein
MKGKIQPMKNRSIAIFATIPSVLACFAFLTRMQAAPQALPSPSPDGCYPGFTTAEGCHALFSLSTGAGNTAVGWESLASDTTASYNSAFGAGTLIINNADSNTAVGAAAMLLNTGGTLNVAVGTDAMVFNGIGDDNTGVGAFALENNTGGVTNAALGVFAAQNTIQSFNVAVGGFSLKANTAGTRNTAVGAGAIETGAAGNDNTAVGELAGNLINGNSNTCLGSSAGSNQTSGEGGIYIGASVQAGTPGEFEFIRIGNDTAFTFPYDTYIAGIYGRPVGPSPLGVMCGSDGKLTANPSSQRFKHDIKPIDKASEAIMALKPVSFRYNNDSTDTPWLGLIAEDVAQVSENLIVRDKEGKPFGVRYDQVNAMLLNEFIREHKKVEEQQASISQLKSEMQTMVAQLKEQATQIQKVSAQLEVSKPAPQVVVNKP